MENKPYSFGYPLSGDNSSKGCGCNECSCGKTDAKGYSSVNGYIGTGLPLFPKIGTYSAVNDNVCQKNNNIYMGKIATSGHESTNSGTSATYITGLEIGATTNTYSVVNNYTQKALQETKVDLIEGIVEMIYKQTPYAYISNGFTTDYNNQDLITKDVYGIKDGKLSLIKTIKGKFVPEEIIPEHFEFEE